VLKKQKLEMYDQGIPQTTLREISLLQALSKSNHIVKLLYVKHFEEAEKAVLYLIFEHLSMDLKVWLDRKGNESRFSFPFVDEVIKSMSYQLLKGVDYCHKHGVMHRDLKPQNILIQENPKLPFLSRLKIGDLGLGRAFSIPIKSYSNDIATLWYRAPEILLRTDHYGLGVDIWSIGCIIGEMMRREPLFPGESEFQQLIAIFKFLGTPNENTWPGVEKLRFWHIFPIWRPEDLSKVFYGQDIDGIDLLKSLLKVNPAKRISAKIALNHLYFKNLDKLAIDLLEKNQI